MPWVSDRSIALLPLFLLAGIYVGLLPTQFPLEVRSLDCSRWMTVLLWHCAVHTCLCAIAFFIGSCLLNQLAAYQAFAGLVCTAWGRLLHCRAPWHRQHFMSISTGCIGPKRLSQSLFNSGRVHAGGDHSCVSACLVIHWLPQEMCATIALQRHLEHHHDSQGGS